MSEAKTPEPVRARGGKRALALKIAIGGSLAAVLLVYFFRGTDLASLGKTLATTSVPLCAAALVIAASGFVIRAYRWRTYLRPVKLVPTEACLEVLMVGYFISLFVPRSGDVVVRPLLLSKSEKVPATAVLATIAVERLFDTLCVVLCFAAYLSFASGRLHGGGIIEHASQTGRTLILASLAGVCFLVLLRFQRERLLAVIAFVLRPLPEHFAERVLRQTEAFANGLNLFANVRNAVVSVLQTVAAWFVVGLSMWLAMQALDLPIRPLDSCLLMGLGALGVAVPTPFGLALLPVIEKGCAALGIADVALAKAGAVLIWALSVVPTAGLGIVAFVRRGVRVREIEAAAEAEADADADPVASPQPPGRDEASVGKDGEEKP